ncbi:amino acid ABC transporter membrane protein 1, PAAT family [Rhizobiales bacterium GAS191]|jgi:polar amino acid transport system permease protein|nr:amino acid ABC transporter membrane protein 1, PAAT family [Rhizobiales bacterium GAS113]SED35299.1 amino acid ABC transporter membrane protein 1, PAAT family [Rhizobiales bacterium GAS188]SEE95752.1 amino acid ABC transporter membrane protein 1, PAAT family [Rhizobiales bacterium GAS191]
MTWKLFYVLVQAAGLTVAISAISIAIGLAIGTLVCAASLSRNRAARVGGKLYVSFFRGAPLLIQLLLLYNLLPAIGLEIPDMVTAVAGLSLCTAAYQAENLRGGFSGVPSGLIEAADMAGLSPLQTFMRIKLPIAVKLTLPAIVNEAILILKASSLVSLVGIVELTETAKNFAASNYRPLEDYAAAGLLYLVLCWLIGGGGAVLERSMRWGRA